MFFSNLQRYDSCGWFPFFTDYIEVSFYSNSVYKVSQFFSCIFDTYSFFHLTSIYLSYLSIVRHILKIKFYNSSIKKFSLFSLLIVVSGPCPENTVVSSGKPSNRLKDSLSFAISPPWKSVLPTEPWKSVSPVNTTPSP